MENSIFITEAGTLTWYRTRDGIACTTPPNPHIGYWRVRDNRVELAYPDGVGVQCGNEVIERQVRNAWAALMGSEA